MNIGQRIKEVRESQGITLLQVANELGVTEATVQRYESGNIKNLKLDTITKIAIFLNVDPAYLMGWKNTKDNLSMKSNYPLYPAISAGLPIGIDGITEQESELITIPDFLMGKYAGNKSIYFTRTNGDSMNKVMPHNTLIAVKSQVELHELKDNDIVVYRNHGEYAVKRFIKTEKELIFRPDSTDGSFRDDVVYVDDANDLTISGKVVMWNVLMD